MAHKGYIPEARDIFAQVRVQIRSLLMFIELND